VSLADARQKALQNKQILQDGGDPKLVKQIPDTIPTFAVAIDAFLLFKLDEFSNDKHKAQWRATLEQYANPVIGDLALDQIKTDHVLSAPRPRLRRRRRRTATGCARPRRSGSTRSTRRTRRRTLRCTTPRMRR
jgi:hypothetical protein